MNNLIVRVNEQFEADRLTKYFSNSYASQDNLNKPVVVFPRLDNLLTYAKESAMILNRSVSCFGMKEDGTKFSLLNKEKN